MRTRWKNNRRWDGDIKWQPSDSRQEEDIPINNWDPIRIRFGSAGKRWPEAGRMFLARRLASGPGPFGQSLTQTARTKLDLGWFCTILSGISGTESESGKLAAGRLRPARNRAGWFPFASLLPDQMRLAKPWPDHPDRIWVGSAQYDLCLLWKNGAETDAGSWIQHIRYGPILAACWL